MQITLTKPVVVIRRLEGWRERMRNLKPAAERIGEKLAREARRRSPRGTSRRGQSLQASIGHREPGGGVTVIFSDKPYAGIQARGGIITAGKGKLHAKMLVIPLNATARRMIAQLGANQSLRSLDLTILESRKGRVFLARTIEAQHRGRKRGRSVRGARREHRFGSMQLLFELRHSVRLKPNPQPDGYVPRASEPEIRLMIVQTWHRWVAEGRL